MKKLFPLICLLASLGASAQDSLNVHLLYHWADTTLPASSAYNNTYNEVWGFVQGGKEYAVIGSTVGTHIFDVSDPVNSHQVAFVPGAYGGPNVVHRDFHDYHGYLYMVSDEGPATLQIADLSYLPDSVHLVYDSNALFMRSHNIFIDSATAKLFVCGGENHYDVYSLANPESPTLLVNCANDVSWWEPTIGYVHDTYVRNDTAYCNAGPNGLFVVDFTNPGNPVLLGSLTSYPYHGYNHSGWLNKRGTVYVLADETWGYDLKLLNVTDLSDINLIDTINDGVDSLSIPHNPIFRDDFLYCSYYHDGTYIWDVHDSSNAFIVGFYDTSTEPNGMTYKGNWGVYPLLPSGIVLSSDMQNGLFVFDVHEALAMSTEELMEKNNVVVFPNPCRGMLNISIPNPSVFEKFELTSLNGQLVYSGSINRSLTSVKLPASLGNGVYFLNLTGTEKHLTKKVVLQK